jgi:dehydrogenase/reductase SDR family protein 12
MAKAFGQFAASTQFYLYGKKHFTATGYERHAREYEQPDCLTETLDISDRVFLITGGNAGIGREMVKFLASHGASVYLVGRSRARAEAAVAEIAAECSSARMYVLEGDVGLEADVRRCWSEFVEHSTSTRGAVRLDGLVCNAGALNNEKELTAEGLEATFASHLLFGTYLLGSLAMPILQSTPQSRFIAVSSGGMYNSAFPSWDVASSTSSDPDVKYNGQSAYIYAKRGQVMLCEQWATKFPEVKVVSAHPGWTKTAAVERAFGDGQKYLEPQRTTWQGAEGIVWLCVAPAAKIESGSFYLDRKPQVKHIAGPFFTEGSFTKNSVQETDAMMEQLEAWANGRRPTDLAARCSAVEECATAREQPLKAMDRPIELSRFMGRWYVIANIPTFFDKGTINNIEEYSFDEASGVIQVDFSYSNPSLTKTSCLQQRASVVNELNTQWKLSPKIGFYLPLSIPYLIADCSEDYSSTIIGVPDRAYVWLMTRTPKPAPEVLSYMLIRAQQLGYDINRLQYPSQEWPEEKLQCAAPEATVEDAVAGA